MKKLSLILLPLMLFLSFDVFADGLFRAQFGYDMDESNSASTTDVTRTRQFIDLAGGYLWSEGFVLGGQYAMEKDDETNKQEGNRTSYGPMLGWISRSDVGPYITGTYYLSSKYVQGGNSYDGNGYQVDLGLRVNLSKIYLVAGMSYESFDYGKNNGAAISPDLKQSHIDPRLGLQLEF